MAKWRGTGPAPTTTPVGHRAACLARVERGGPVQLLQPKHWAPATQTPRILSPGSGTRAFPAQRQHPEGPTRPRPQKVCSDACGHTRPPSEGLLQIREGAPGDSTPGQGRLYTRPSFLPIRPLCPLCGCPRDKSAPYPLGHSSARGATERAHRKRCSPLHANNNLML